MSRGGRPPNPNEGRKTSRIELHSLTGGFIRDITPFVSYVQVFSSLDSPFMEATIALSDQERILADNVIDGDVAITFHATAGNNKTLEGKFHINSVATWTQNNNMTNGLILQCVGLEHIHNASQKVQESKYWYKPQTISNIIADVASKYLGISLKSLASTSPAVNINIPRMHPMQAITMLVQRAHGQGKNVYVFFQRFFKSKPAFFFEEVSTLMAKGPIWTFLGNEASYGKEADDPDEDYLSGAPISKIVNMNSHNFFNTHENIKAGYCSRSYWKMDFVNKTYKRIDDVNQHVVIGEVQAPAVVGLSNSKADIHFNRTTYEPFNGDSTYYTDPLLEDNYKTSKPVASSLANKRVTVATYGCPEIGPGDVVFIDTPPSDASERAGAKDEDFSKNYLVYACEHYFGGGGNKLFQSKFLLASDGKR